ncbi:pro-FMRFamide-related neuropeptide VF [Cricetulus griseus]|uniref:Pro-FMRFamide-related neuropeptide VF n=1 Tax=Cricetulus griseus TaxID=10029 RepID=A0A8C2M0V3_CRIGR|nr:pro-FMRFamide-related neuropeptide VF [Cricetulus griseus]XP_027285555.1 pro-FMRFamide-related neuropeptide VF [Cricetulus griseus]ERE66054.1 FMRFamide-related peptides-like protein [Cricetulus griseus]
MEIISSKRFILLTLATSSLLTSNIFCTDELMVPHCHSKEKDGKYSQPRGIPKGEKERSVTFQELKDWGAKNVIKMSPAPANKVPHSAANLPLRFGRTLEEERSPRARANMEAMTLSRVPSLPQRFGRTTARSIPKTLSHLLQRSLHSLATSELLYAMTCQHQEIQSPDGKQARRQAFMETDDEEGKHEK